MVGDGNRYNFSCNWRFCNSIHVFYKLVIYPLSEAITELKNMIIELRADFLAESEKRNDIDKRVTILEEKVKHVEEVVK